MSQPAPSSTPQPRVQPDGYGWIDAHCHLDSSRLAHSSHQTWSLAQAAHVEALVMAGVDPEGWQAQRKLAENYANVFPVFGLHPQYIPELSPTRLEDELSLLDRALESHKGFVVGLGETGLDRLSEETKAALPLQKVAFREQLRLAKRYELPVVLHLLKANAEALTILREEKLPAAGGVVHSFSGSKEFALELTRLGLHLSFCGSLAYPQSRRLKEAALAVARERVLVETDSPDQTPPPYQGQPNQPAYVPIVGQALADVWGCSLEEVRKQTRANAIRLFRLPLAEEV